ncbi:nesprin-3-like [Salvelinus alpinus]|uniref:nesprin-3-like n=1 Tax=Salvelinus alpinus TaxID=8036 RepID=UPI0039FC295C
MHMSFVPVIGSRELEGEAAKGRIGFGGDQRDIPAGARATGWCVQMTHQEQQEILFRESLEAAMSWMLAVQERLRLNDNTQGPRAALEARLRETEKIHQSEHEGHVKFDKVLVAAEVLLQNGNQGTRNITHARLKELKALWEDTCTYIIHCHSRIEWVWLHWSEYLKAYGEFEMWLVSVRRSLEPEVELQLGVKEKLWQVDNQRVLLSDVQNQALLLERLVDEAAALHNRIQDPSVDQEAQERLQLAYNSIRDKAEERLSVLQKMAEEHQMYQRDVLKFQAWLVSKTKELNTLTETEDTAENKLRALQTLDDNVASEERTLQHIEVMAEAVRANTSPGGADVVVEEAEELRLDWQRLRQSLCEAGESLKSSLDSQSQYQSRCQRLGEDIRQLRGLLHRLTRGLETAREGDRTRDLETAREGDRTGDLETAREGDRTRDLEAAREGDRTGDLETASEGDRIEEQMVGQWRKYMNIRNTLLAEESQVEHLKAQLKELFRFSQDSQHLSVDVLAVVKEQQSVKCRAVKLCVESELGLRQVLQDPLHGFSQWSQVVSQVLESSAEVSEFSHVAMLVQNIQRLLKHSLQLQEQLRLMLLKRDLLCSVFGSDRAESLMTELNDTVRSRELLHNQLLQRKARLQGLISRTKDFGDACKSIRNKLTLLRERLISADSLQPDILAKKSQSDQQRVIKKDLEDCEAHITALETLVSSSSANRTQFERLYGDWRILYKSVRVKVKESEESIGEHESFHESLLNVEKWLMIMRQKLESYRSSTGEWSLDNRQQEAERALGEFPEKELQLHQTEVQGQGVLERTSEEGRVHILRDMKHLRESWMALHDLSLNLFRLLNGHSSEDHDLDTQRERVRGQAGERAGPGRELFPGEGGDMIKGSGSSSSREGALERSPGEGHGVWLSQSSGVGAGRGGRTGLGGRLEQGEGVESFGAEEGIWVEGAFEGSMEVMDLSEHGERQGRDRQTLGQQLSPMTLTLAGSQRRGQGGGSGSREREREKERGGGEHSLGVEEVDSSIVWRGGYGQRGEEGTTGMTSGHTGGRSTHVGDSGSRVSRVVGDSGSRVSGVVGDSGSRVSGVVGDSGSRVSGVVVLEVSGSSSRGGTEEWVAGQRSRGMDESLAMEVDVGLGSGSGPGHGSRGNYEEGTGEMRDHSEGGHLRHRGFFPPIKTRMEDSVMDGLTLSFQQGSARKPSGRLQGSSHHTTAGVGATLSAGDYEDRRREFEAWLQKENDTLSGILSTEGPLSTKELKIRQNTLMTLRSSVDWGQEQFQLLLMAWAVAGARADRGAEDVGMEEIRYRWMLYKSKLKDVGDLEALLNVKQGASAAGREEHTRTAKEKTPGLLYRVCRVALPLWLLLLALLLFAFFLPWMDEGSSCSLSNNFARSFNIMLRYHGPPPT